MTFPHFCIVCCLFTEFHRPMSIAWIASNWLAAYSNVRCGVYAVYCHTENEKIDWKRKTFCKWVSETKNSSDSIKRKAIWKIQHISNGSLAIVIPFSVRFMFYGFCFLFSSVSYMLQINHIESVFMLLNFCHSSSVFFTLFLKNITLTVLFSFTYNSDLNSYATWVSSFGFVTCIVVFAIFLFLFDTIERNMENFIANCFHMQNARRFVSFFFCLNVSTLIYVGGFQVFSSVL